MIFAARIVTDRVTALLLPQQCAAAGYEQLWILQLRMMLLLLLHLLRLLLWLLQHQPLHQLQPQRRL